MGDVSAKTEVGSFPNFEAADENEFSLDILSTRSVLEELQSSTDEKTEKAIKLEPIASQQAEVQAKSGPPAKDALDAISDDDKFDLSAIDFEEQFNPIPVADSAPKRPADLPKFDESGGTRGSISGLISIGMATLILSFGIYRTTLMPSKTTSAANSSYIQEASFGSAEANQAESGYDSESAILSPSVRKSEQTDSSWLEYVHAHMGDEHMSSELFPKRAYRSSDFGYRVDPFTKAWKFHHGFDIAMKHGEKVRSLMPGKIIVAGHLRGYGRVVMVKHEHGLVTVYAHLSKVLVKKGDEIASYQPVGRVGMTGRATGPHLHFEVQLNGKKIDPNIMPQLAKLSKKKKRRSRRK
jgi:murein DD-endopeptidase MepM/ murein hydrolase activator NlpD